MYNNRGLTTRLKQIFRLAKKSFCNSRRLNLIITITKNIFFNHNICILGMDGTGKTSTINVLKEKLQVETRVQYMGFREHVSWLGKKRFNEKVENKKNTITSKALNMLIGQVEMWSRVIPHWCKNYIVIYDRYAWGIYDNSEGVSKVIGKLFFKYLFPKPKYVFYLYCPIEESLSRKNDIIDIEAFRMMKERFDKEYLNSNSVVVINTAEHNIESTVKVIINNLPNKYGEYL